jgi:hypothetical protein
MTLSHEQMMDRAWRFIAELGIADKDMDTYADAEYRVENIHAVRDAYYDDLENGVEIEGEDMEGFFARHGIEVLEAPQTLYELTSQECGIVVYNTGVIVTNWSNTCRDGGLPRMAPGNLGIIAWPDEIAVIKEYRVTDIRDALPGTIVEVESDNEGQTLLETDGMDIVYDRFGDIPALWGWDTGLGACINKDDSGNLAPTEGRVFELDGAIVIAPDGWN